MKKPVVLVDMDDTLCHLIKKCIQNHNENWPDHPMRYEDCLKWEYDHIWHPDCSEEWFFGKPGLYEELELLDQYVVEEMRKLHEAYEVIIVTAAWPHAVTEKWNWMQKHLPFIPYSNFMAAKKKYLIAGDILIDDAIHNLIPFHESGRAVIGIPHPWNSAIQDRVYFKHDGWKDMKQRVDQILMDRGIIPRPA